MTLLLYTIPGVLSFEEASVPSRRAYRGFHGGLRFLDSTGRLHVARHSAERGAASREPYRHIGRCARSQTREPRLRERTHKGRSSLLHYSPSFICPRPHAISSASQSPGSREFFVISRFTLIRRSRYIRYSPLGADLLVEIPFSK